MRGLMWGRGGDWSGAACRDGLRTGVGGWFEALGAADEGWVWAPDQVWGDGAWGWRWEAARGRFPLGGGNDEGAGTGCNDGAGRVEIPAASAGMTVEGRGCDSGNDVGAVHVEIPAASAGMTEWGAGMTVEGAGITGWGCGWGLGLGPRSSLGRRKEGGKGGWRWHVADSRSGAGMTERGGGNLCGDRGGTAGWGVRRAGVGGGVVQGGGAAGRGWVWAPDQVWGDGPWEWGCEAARGRFPLGGGNDGNGGVRGCGCSIGSSGRPGRGGRGGRA